MRQVISMADEIFGQCDEVARDQPVAAVPALFDVGRGYHQDVAVPFAGGKSHPSVRRVFRWMRPPVHIDCARLLISADVLLYRYQSVRRGIPILPNSQLQWTSIDIRGCMRLALVLLQREPVWIPAQSPLAGIVLNRKAEVSHQRRPWDPLIPILRILGGPLTRKNHLRGGDAATDSRQCEC